MKKIFTSVDIGSDTVKILVSEIYGDNINVIASNTIKSKGIRKGLNGSFKPFFVHFFIQ